MRTADELAYTAQRESTAGAELPRYRLDWGLGWDLDLDLDAEFKPQSAWG